MAFTQLAAAFSEGSDSPYATSSVSPAGGSLVILCMTVTGEAAGPTPTSVSGVCTSWTFAGSSGFDGANGGWAHTYWGIATGTPGTITVTFADECFGFGYNVVEVTGADTVVQWAQATGSSTALACTLAAFAGANWTFAFGIGQASAATGAAFVAGAVFTELAGSDTDTQFGFQKACEWQEAADTSVTMDMANTGLWGIIGLEVGVAGAADLSVMLGEPMTGGSTF